jgi:membrane protein
VRTIRDYWQMLKQAFWAWNDDYAASMGAALAYYTVFSLAPLLLIVIAIAGMLFGAEAARGAIVDELGGLMGTDGAKAIQDLLEATSRPSSSLLASLIGSATLLIGATTVLAELQSALDRIWRAPVQQPISGLFSILRARVLSLGMLVALAFLLLVSLVLGAALTAVGKWSGTLFPGMVLVLQALNLGFSFAVTTVLFASAYRILPRVRIAWSDVWTGAVVTAVLFTVGKYLIGLYLGRAGVSSGFGAAGSLVVILVWVYYSAQIFLLGAEFTWVYAHRRGSRRGTATGTATAGPAPAAGMPQTAR